MEQREIRLTIDSDLKNVSVVGTAVHRFCSFISSPDISTHEIELCVVEAVNNCIEHAYEKEKGHDVEVLFTLHQNRLVVDICDTGKPMDNQALKQADKSMLEIDLDAPESIAEKGRGLPIIKEIMDTVVYTTESGRNCLSMTKRFTS